MAAVRGIVLELGNLRIDVPRSLGYYGGVATAVALGIVDPPLGAFIACVPLLRMATNSRAPEVVQWIGQVLDGLSKPVGGDAEGTIRLADPPAALAEAAETQALARLAPESVRRAARRQAARHTDSPSEPDD